MINDRDNDELLDYIPNPSISLKYFFYTYHKNGFIFTCMILTATEEIRMSSRHLDPSDFGNVTGQGQFQFTRCQVPNLDTSEIFLLVGSTTNIIGSYLSLAPVTNH